MTYEETVRRMVHLMFVAHEKRWVDKSLRNLTGDWLRRIEERFAGVDGRKTKPSLLQTYSTLDEPTDFIKKFFADYPEATNQLLAAEDKAYFLAISQRPGQKPAPFIPVLDASFEVWFKKVSHISSCLDHSVSHSIEYYRIRSGPRRTSMPSSTRTRSVCVSCRAPSL